MEHRGRFYSINKRIVYVLGFLFVAIPVAVGLLTWYFTSSECEINNNAATAANQGSQQSTTTSLPDTPEVPEPWKNLRLPVNVEAIHYDITLYPDFYDNGWFYGNESVELLIKQETSHILIHFNFLNITRIVLRNNQTNEIIVPNRTFSYEPNQFLVVETVMPLKAGTVVKLELQFDGSLTRAIIGFYKSTYINSITSETRNLAASKFQPVAARRAFPCLDEPNFKAEYTIRLIHKPEYRALSNMPIDSEEEWTVDNTLRRTSFKRSVKMSTYLVAFIVCDFDYLNTVTSYGKPVRTFATPDKVNQTEYSLQIANDTMQLYQDLFNVEYPLPKQDMVAIPDYVSGATEHWGLIGYRETNMLYDKDQASPANKQRVAIVVAHEIAHMWFGNIVTMDWWDDLWLNEGFASFMEYIGVNGSEPEWDMMSQFVTEDVQTVMINDAGVYSHPIIVAVESPDQINEVFDVISYSKGAAVIAMLQTIVGKDVFFAGVGDFLTKFKWSNAKTDDLWASIGKVSDELTVKDVMDTWTIQMGFPYIDIVFDQTKNQATATQRRFMLNGNTVYNESESIYRYRWHVYLDYFTSDSRQGHTWINREDQVTFNIPINPLIMGDTWIKFNIGQTGFYRVKYPGFLWDRFATLLQRNPQILADVDKTGLISDAFNLARSGYLPYQHALGLTLYLNKEYNHLPWESAYQAFSYISNMLSISGEGYGVWRKYILQKAKPVLTQVGWETSNSHLDNLMRVNLISLVCGLGDSECLQNASTRFNDWVNKGISVEPNLRSQVYKFGMKKATVTEWDFMWNRYKIESVPQERINLLYGMSQTQQIWLLKRFLDYTKDESMVRSQDFFTVLIYISRNPVGNSVVWDWTRINWPYLVDRFTLYSRSFGRLVPNIISSFNSNFKLSEVQDFFRQYPDAGAGARGRLQAVESIQSNINWMNSYQNPIVDWLNQQVVTK